MSSKTEVQAGVWVVYWEESERGWGTRPDGCWLYPTKEAADSDTKRMVKSMRDVEATAGYGAHNVPEEYTRPAGEPRFIPADKELAKKVAKEKKVYREKWL